MRPAIRRLALVCLAVFFCCAPRLWAVNVPDWVKQAASQTLPSYPADTKAVVLLEEESATVTSPGEYVQHRRRAVRILRLDGRDEGFLSLYLGEKEKVLSLRAWAIDKTGREYEIKEKDFVEVSPYSDEFFSDIHYRTAKAPAPEPGSVIAIEYEVRRHDWDNQLDWVLQDGIPVHEATFILQLPSGWEFKNSWAGTPALKPTDAVANRWQWTKRDLPAIEEEYLRPAFRALSARMTVAFFPPGQSSNTATWEGIGRWQAGLAAGRRTPTPEITEKVRSLTAGQTTFDGKLRAMAAFVQTDVRYVAIEIGIGGFQAHPAGDVFQHRYGDCKDKATLLGSMLQEAGIRSNDVIIHTERGIVDPTVPSTDFNHAILAVELPDATVAKNYHSVVTAKSGKQYLIFDPTDTYTPVGYLRSDLQDTYALLVTDSGGEMIHTPLFEPETNLVSRTGHFVLAADGTLTGEILESRNGNPAAYGRSSLRHANEKERTAHFERELGSSLKGFTLQSIGIQQLDEIQKDLLVNLKFTAPAYAQIRGPLMLVRPRVMGENSFEIDHRKPRKYPVAFEGTLKETDVYEIELPQGYTVDEVPETPKVDAGFASYESKIEIAGTKLRYSRQYTRKDLQIPAERMADLRKFEGVIGADEMATVVLKKVQ